MKPKTVELISKMISQGYELRCSQHREGLSGYSAMFNDRTKRRKEYGWPEAGHGHTLEDAIDMAACIAMNLPFTFIQSREFEE